MIPSQQIAIIEAFDAARAAQPRLPAIEIAERLSISEGELQAARLGRDVWTLPLSPSDIAAYLPQLGRVKALTRSRLAVLEQTGDYPELSGGEHTGLLLDPGGLDLRLLYTNWHWACLIRDPMPATSAQEAQWRWSLQIFNQHGCAVHKCFALENPLPRSWGALAALGTRDTPAFTQSMPRLQRPLPEAPTLASEWGAMRDVHQFFALLQRHHLERIEANQLMEGRYTRALPLNALEAVLQHASQRALPLMLFVASPGCVQIRTGTLPTPQRARGWLNLFGEQFTLHLDDTAIDQVWQVSKPNRDGGVTSIEAFDAEGSLVLQLYAQRQEGRAERREWRQLLDELGRQEAVA
ncbi:heme degradation protein [Halomonas sp. FeN2]|uniref:ChuX/HutX family heme-like substrate-binding protein n=1 Tax=Halomonas sp. FeN2 TaxID=2832500 RepID=UPI000C4EE077|nr:MULTISPECIES: ChuX/HutX family heme-like substrate-binding protein [unclassified Halomonas]MBF56453.1 heme degradation protein [Halomonas sp.]UBR51510.1 heme degradation protein [Halomonas sp. FeN2]|tara:strand:+ start:151 stop:1206 length:1056 start_codon:yes stop_codon:yes gene_type:complete